MIMLEQENQPLRIALLGASGSIGEQTLAVIAAHPDAFRLQAASVGSDMAALRTIVSRFGCRAVAVADPDAARQWPAALLGCECLAGEDANAALCEREDVDAVVIALPGMQAIHPLLAAIRSHKRLAVANKECLVCGGDYVQGVLAQHGACLYPIDSEQSAIFQCLQGLSSADEVDRLILTASGGPFRQHTAAQMRHMTVRDALAHPNWSMGAKISIDSATLINKGLEVIEAHFLFGIPAEKIDVRVHPQSIVHSMVQTIDGAVLAQLGEPDMRLPIQYALTFPKRWTCPAQPPRWANWTTLTFEAPDMERFPGLALAYEALRMGGSATAVYNAADEVAVEAFLQEKIGFLDIHRCVERALQQHQPTALRSLEDILAADAQARALTREQIAKP